MDARMHEHTYMFDFHILYTTHTLHTYKYDTGIVIEYVQKTRKCFITEQNQQNYRTHALYFPFIVSF